MGNKAYDSYESFPYSLVVDGERNEPTYSVAYARTMAFSRAGINNPNWKSDIKQMSNASTPMQVDFFKITATGPRCIKHYTIVKSPPLLQDRRTFDECVGLFNWFDFSAYWSHFVPYNEEASSKAISKLYRKIQNAHHQFQGGVFVGEFRKTAVMIAGAATRLKRGVLDYLVKGIALKKKRGDPKKPLNDLYLETVFGWQPLIGDVTDGAKAIGRLLHENVPVRFRAQGEANTETYSDLGINPFNAGGTFRSERSVSSKSIMTYYGAFKGTVDDNGIGSAAQHVVSMAGFDLRSFIPTVWELIPYSFLIDYFVNVGELLEAMCTDTGSPMDNFCPSPRICYSRKTRLYQPLGCGKGIYCQRPACCIFGQIW
jgi:hypothetical protein